MSLLDQIKNSLKELTDDQLAGWDDALRAAAMIKDEYVRARFQLVSILSWDKQMEFSDLIDDEIIRRAAIKQNAMVAHTVEQGEAFVEEGKEMPNYKLMAYRAARLIRLIQLNAPDVIIKHSFDVLAKMEVEV